MALLIMRTLTYTDTTSPRIRPRRGTHDIRGRVKRPAVAETSTARAAERGRLRARRATRRGKQRAKPQAMRTASDTSGENSRRCEIFRRAGVLICLTGVCPTSAAPAWHLYRVAP